MSRALQVAGEPRPVLSPVVSTRKRCRNSLMSFLNLRIRGRLYGGFGALLLFCVALAGFAVWQLGEIRTQVAAMTVQSGNAIRAGGIATELQAIRRAILRYAFDHDEASSAEAEKRLAKVSDLVEAAIKTTKSDERRAGYKEIAKDVEELKVSALRSERRSCRRSRAGTCCLPTATRWRPTSRNSSMPRTKPISPRELPRLRPKFFWSGLPIGGCWRRATKRVSPPSKPMSEKLSSRSQSWKRPSCRKT